MKKEGVIAPFFFSKITNMKNSLYNFLISINGQDILYNTLSGKYIKATPELMQYINGEKANEQLNEELERNCFLVKDDINEMNLVKNLYLQKRYSSRRYLLTINTSLDCNLNCWYCYETHLAKSNMTLDLVERILKHLDLKFQTEPFEVLELSFFGGEPMINYKAIEALLNGVQKQAEKNNFKVLLAFTTNGTMISSKYINLLSPFKTRFQITIDGDRDMHNSIRKFKTAHKQNSYECVLKGLHLLNSADADFRFTIRINYNEKVLNNISSLIKDISFLDKKRTIVSLQKIWQCDESAIDITLLFNVIDTINNVGYQTSTFKLGRKFDCCYADNLNQAVINYNGKVFKCTARDFIEEKAYGYLNSLGMIEWNTDLIKKRMALSIPLKCQECNFLPCCPGICSQKILEKKDEEIACPFPKGVSKESIILLNIKQQLISLKHEKK